MDLDLDKGLVLVFDKKYKLDALANKLAGLSGAQIYGFFSNRGLLLPRQMNCMALISILNEKLKTLMSNSLSKENFSRLLYYKYYSEIQLQSLFNQICDEEDYRLYRVSFLKLMILNFVSLNLTDGEIQYLITIRKQTPEAFDKYNEYIAGISCEQEGTFDGQSINLLKSYYAYSITTADLTALSSKYGLEIPDRLSKEQLIEYMSFSMNEKGEYTEELGAQMAEMPITNLVKMCKEYQIDMASNMNKQQTIDYLFFYLSLCDIVTSSVNRIEHTEEYEPLEFRIDFAVPMGFAIKEPQKVIFYKHKIVNDNGEEVLVEEDILQTTPLASQSKSYLVRSRHKSVEPESAATDSIVQETNPSSTSQVLDKPVLVSDPLAMKVDIIEEEPVDKELSSDETKKELEIANDDDSEKIPMDEVIVNENFESNKFINLDKGNGSRIILAIILILLLALVIYIVCTLLIK